MDWLSDKELAAATEENARQLGLQIEDLTREIKALEAEGELAAAERKRRLRKLYRQDRKQLIASAAALQAGLADKAPVGSHGAWRGAVSMEKW